MNLADTEKNDCAVRALAVARGMEYNEAHRIFAEAGRLPRHRTKNIIVWKIYEDAGLTRRVPYLRITVRRFLREHPNFTGIIHVRGHAFGVVGGYICHDWMSSNSTSIVTDYWD